MAHHIYTTNAYILESHLSGEADRFFTLFTQDLGVIRANAKGVRLQKSKLRYSLQDLSRSRISLVRGKEIWRITSARIEDSLYTTYRDNKPVLHVIAHILGLVKRLVAGEEKNETLFNLVTDAFVFLEIKTDWEQNELKLFEIIAVLKMLENLGYMKKVRELEQFIKDPWSEALLREVKNHKVLALKEINSSLKESQL